MDLTLAEHPVYVYTGGRPVSAAADQPTVLFIHGAQQDHSCWTLQSRWFAHHGYTTLVPDLPGHGRSGGPPLTSVEALADWSHSPHGQLGGNAVPGLWMLGLNGRLMERQPPGTFAADLGACNGYHRPLVDLADLGVPTLVLAAAGDRMTPPKAARSIAEALPRGRLQVLPGGHALMAEQPGAVLDALRAFIGEPDTDLPPSTLP